MDYSLIVVRPLRMRLAVNPSLTEGDVMLSVTVQYNSHTFSPLSVAGHVFQMTTASFLNVFFLRIHL